MHHLILIALVVVSGFQIDARTPILPPPRPVQQCFCPTVYSPVCSTKGVTYSNECELRCAARYNNAIKLACGEKCPCTCSCTKEYRPICGTDGKTYGNKCNFECARRHQNSNLKIQCHGQCPCTGY